MPVRALALTCWLAAIGALFPGLAFPQAGDGLQNVELEPIACYWRTSTDAVRIGEPFLLVLSCSVIDTAATTVVPDQSRLDPGVLQLQPFEVVGGTQSTDLRTATRRHFQYEYRLRYVGEEVGRDLQLPALTLTYRVQSRVGRDDAAVEGRERQYILPAHTVRILSIVPAAARDIRDTAPVTLAEISARRFRASMLRIGTWTLYGAAACVAVWGLMISARRRTPATTLTRHASDATILGGVLTELDAIRRVAAADGWTDTLAARALAALRVAASYAASLHVAQTPARRSATPLSGQLRVATGWLRRSDVLVSGAASASALARLQKSADRLEPADIATLQEFEAVLTRFSEAAYGRATPETLNALDAALAAGQRAVAAVKREHTWLALQLRSFAQRTGDHVKARGWVRS